MNLVHVKDTYIGQGDRLRGISGGEKRRLAFASEASENHFSGKTLLTINTTI